MGDFNDDFDDESIISFSEYEEEESDSIDEDESDDENYYDPSFKSHNKILDEYEDIYDDDEEDEEFDDEDDINNPDIDYDNIYDE